MSRQTLGKARSSKKDEFYTLYEDVKFELYHYINQFKDKVIYCPSDTEDSAFVKYFLELKTKGLIKEVLYTSLQDGTDFLSADAIDWYNHSDIVVTNPPFSLFRPFLSLLDSLNKKFIIWGTNNAIGYSNTSEMLVRDRIQLGYIVNKSCFFEVPSDYVGSKIIENDGKQYINVPSCTVFTNLSVTRSSPLVLTKHLDDSYTKYDNFDAINCNKTSDIPIDYDGYIGVPITYLGKHDSSKFKIVGIFNNFKETNYEVGQITGSLVNLDKPPYKTRGPVINGRPTYIRLIIQKKS